MRIVVCNSTRRKVGGIEDYLSSLLPQLQQEGHPLCFVSEVDTPVERKALEIPTGAPDWCIQDSGATQVLDQVRAWKPDLLYCHGPLKDSLERQLLAIAPAVYFAHNYYGTCIGGYKAHQFPTPMPCQRTLGPSCLALYLPRRCGGLNPVTMLRLYNRETRRLENLKQYRAIVTHSDHMRREFANHGIAEERLFNFVPEGQEASEYVSGLTNMALGERQGPKRLLFLGRMEALKGGRALIDAAVLVQRQIDKPVQVVFGGDGPEKDQWQRLSRQATDTCPLLSFRFTGWLNRAQVASELDGADVLVVPSLWPEPFGRVGLAAAQHGVPAAAFAVGGIPEWLKDGVNGFLAPGDPPTAGGLAGAIVRCLDQRLAPGLRLGAKSLASRFSQQSHFQQLMRAFEFAVGDG